MRGLIAIFLLSIYLFGTTEAYQALKLPILIEHFVKHMDENPQLTLLDLLKLHYSGKKVFDADYRQDMRLPFKTQENTNVFNAVNDVPRPVCVRIEPPLAGSIDYVLIDIWIDLPAFPHSVFQPPRA